MRYTNTSIACFAPLLWACTAQIEGNPAGSAGGDATDEVKEPSEPGPNREKQDPDDDDWTPGAKGDPTAAPLYAPRLLAKREYNSTLHLILRDTYEVIDSDVDFTASLPTEAPDASGFLAPPDVSAVSAQGYLEASRTVADAVAPKLASLLGCNIDEGDDADCIGSFTASFGELLYRRPLTAAEIEEHVGFYDESRNDIGLSKRDAALSLLRMMLTSPYFLYQWEQGHEVSSREGDIARLNPFQIASRLSFFLWGSGPDRALIELARSGGLDSDDEVAEQAKTMMASERAVATIDAFHEQWLRLDDLPNLNKNTERFPSWTPALGAAMAEEVRLFTREVMLKGSASVADLLTSTDTFANGSIAEIYGVSGVAGEAFEGVRLPSDVRAGLLTMPGFLAAASGADNPKPFHLGALLLERFYCQTLTPADPDLIASVPAPKQDPAIVGERAYLEEQTNHPTCLACHAMMNPLAFGLGNFDSLGALREKDQHGVPVQADGILFDAEFSGPRELAALMANDEQVEECLTKQWFRFATRHRESPADVYSLEQGFQRAKKEGGNLRELMLALTSSRSFLYRQVEEGETLQ